MDAPLDRADPLPVYVLIGGASRRFGADKASHPVDGEPWALHVARRLARSADPVVLVGDPPSHQAFGDLPVIPDAAGSPGPLGGVLAALADRESRNGPGWLCLASCDLVRPERVWLSPLLHARHSAPRSEGVAYRDANGWQPFPSIVNTCWLEGLTQLAAEGVTSLQEAFTASRVIDRPWEGAQAGPPQANTPEALREFLSMP